MVKLINEWKYPDSFDYDRWKSTEPDYYDSDIDDIIPDKATIYAEVEVDEIVDGDYYDDEDYEYSSEIEELDFDVDNQDRLDFYEFADYIRYNAKRIVKDACRKENMRFVKLSYAVIDDELIDL